MTLSELKPGIKVYLMEDDGKMWEGDGNFEGGGFRLRVLAIDAFNNGNGYAWLCVDDEPEQDGDAYCGYNQQCVVNFDLGLGWSIELTGDRSSWPSVKFDVVRR